MSKRSIPTKAELLRLQKLYKTDEKIGERLGGVAAYLVAYWRRKKNIPKYSLPKFSEAEIRNLWERYGDDEKAGLELGISKAAFYNWRRRYGFREKPAFLKLEQLELNFPGMVVSSHSNSLYGNRSVVQKVLARLSEQDRVEIGQEIEIEPDLTATPIAASEVIEAFSRKSDLVWNPGKIVLMLGDDAGATKDDLAERQGAVRDFARRQGIKAFYDLSEGTCCQIALERGHIVPGRLILGVGDRTAAYGAMSSLVMPIDAEAMGQVWAGEKYKTMVPDTVRIVINGRRARGVGAIDIALEVVGQLSEDDLSGRVIEYSGSAISQMSIGQRFTFSALLKETGAQAAICVYDATTRRYLTGRTMNRFQPVIPDKDAEYSQLYQVNIDQLGPLAAPQNEIAQPKALAALQNLPVQLVVLGSCMAGRFEDLRAAAEILKGQQVHDGCRLYVIPGSRAVYLEALKKGLIRVFVEAGAIVMHPAGPGLSGDLGAPAEGERALTTTPLGLGSDNSDIHICSPATAAASALNGVITDPTRYGR
jgi:homoaconitase/3-isopropylmalate dehydratase large subunit